MVEVVLLKQKSIKANAIQFLDDESSKKEILKVLDNYHIQ
jgi:hypothetical protein